MTCWMNGGTTGIIGASSRRVVSPALDCGEMIDLRSDTQTKPSRAMREAMAAAEVGDEQEREDPTVLELERRGAELLGHEEAAHIMVHELGGAAMHSGLQTRWLPGDRGRLSIEQLRATMRADGTFHTP